MQAEVEMTIIDDEESDDSFAPPTQVNKKPPYRYKK
jgi:hypothetical protein